MRNQIHDYFPRVKVVSRRAIIGEKGLPHTAACSPLILSEDDIYCNVRGLEMTGNGIRSKADFDIEGDDYWKGRCSETRLCASMLLRAFMDLSHWQMKRDAYGWIFSNDTSYLFSFLNVCGWLRIDPIKTRLLASRIEVVSKSNHRNRRREITYQRVL